MINLLPPKDKKELADKKTEKIVLILGGVILILLICWVLIVSSLRFYVLGQVVVSENNFSESQKNYEKNYVDVKDKILQINKKTSELDYFYKNNTYLTQPLKIVSEVSRPNSLYFTNVFVSQGKSKDVSIIISGFADTRDSLLIYKDNLEKDKRIKSFNFSAESWTKNKNIDFYLNINIASTN